MILHLMNDTLLDPYIINQIEENFPGENLYVKLTDNHLQKLQKPNSHTNVFDHTYLLNLDFANIEGIVIHYLSMMAAQTLMRMPNEIPVAISLWGGDFYNFLPEYRQNIYSLSTRQYLNLSRNKPDVYYILKDKIFFRFSRNYRVWQNAINRSKIYSTVIPYEAEQVGKHFSITVKHLSLPTNSIEKVLDVDDYEATIRTKESFQMKILLGNSGNPSNNHIEILNYLKNLDNKDISVHLPLTYGNIGYINHICETGGYLLGDNFHPLLKQLSIDKYFSFINSFNVFIFNSYRQQGIGTIIMALWAGGKVFLSNKNVTKSFYRDNGIFVFSIEDDFFQQDQSELFMPLTRDEILTNRKGLLKLYSNKIVNNFIKIFFRQLRWENTLT